MASRKWIHLVLHVGCVLLLLFQGYRIQQLQRLEAKQHAVDVKVRHTLFSVLQLKESRGWNVDIRCDEQCAWRQGIDADRN
jgi:hypothetical protein